MGKIDHDKALAKYLEGKSDSEISLAFGCTPEAVAGWRKKHDLRATRKPGPQKPAPEPARVAVAVEPAAEVEELKADQRRAGQQIKELATGYGRLQVETDRLRRQVLFLRGVAIGAGVLDIDELLAGMGE